MKEGYVKHVVMYVGESLGDGYHYPKRVRNNWGSFMAPGFGLGLNSDLGGL